MALQEGRSVFFDEMCIWCLALTALDVRVHISNDCLSQALWWDSSLEAGSWTVTRSRGTQLVENVLVHVVVITVHHGNNFSKIAEDGIRTLNHDLRLRQSPTCPRGNILRDIVTRSVEQRLIIKVAHDEA